MNNDENLNGQTNAPLENNVNPGGVNPPLQEVTVETSVPEEPYPQTDVSGSIDNMMGEPTVAPAPTEATVAPASSEPVVAPEPVPMSGPEPMTTASAAEVTAAPTGSTGFEDVQKKSKLGLIIAIIAIIVLGAAGYFIYMTFFTEGPYESAITNVFKTLKSGRDNVSTKVTTTVKVDAKDESYAFLKDYSIDYVAGYNNKENTMAIKINLNEKGTSLIDVLAFIKDNKAYLQSGKITDKTYYVDLKETMGYDFNDMLNMDDIYYLVDVYEKALKEALKDEKPTKTDVKLSVDTKTIDAKEIAYTIDNNNIKRVTSNMYDVILKDDKALEIMAKISEEEKSELKADMEKEKNEATMETPVKISVYTKGFLNTFAGFAITQDKEEVIKYVIDGDNISASIGSMGYKVLATGTVDNVAMKVVSDGKELGNGTVKTNGDTVTAVINVPDVVVVTITMKTEENGKVDTMDTTGATKIDDITEEETEKMETKLLEILQNTDLYKKLMEETSGSSGYIESSYTIDDAAIVPDTSSENTSELEE